MKKPFLFVLFACCFVLAVALSGCSSQKPLLIQQTKTSDTNFLAQDVNNANFLNGSSLQDIKNWASNKADKNGDTITGDFLFINSDVNASDGNFTNLLVNKGNLVLNNNSTPNVINPAMGTTVFHSYTQNGVSLAKITEAPADWVLETELSTTFYSQISFEDAVTYALFLESGLYGGEIYDFQFDTALKPSDFSYLQAHWTGNTEETVYYSADFAKIFAYNFDTTTWDEIASINGDGITTTKNYAFTVGNIPNYFSTTNHVYLLLRTNNETTTDCYLRTDYVALNYVAKTIITDNKWIGDLNVNGNLTVTGSINPKNLIPSIADNFYLGNWGKKWLSTNTDYLNVYNSAMITNDITMIDSSLYDFGIIKTGQTNPSPIGISEQIETGSTGSTATGINASFSYGDAGNVWSKSWESTGLNIALQNKDIIQGTGTTKINSAGKFNSDYTWNYSSEATATYGTGTKTNLVGGVFSTSQNFLNDGGGSITFANNFQNIGALFLPGTRASENVAFTGTNKYWGWGSNNNVAIATNKRIYLEGTIDNATGITEGDTWIDYNSANSKMDFVVDNNMPLQVNTSSVTIKKDANITGNLEIDGNLSVKRPFGMFSSTKTFAIGSTSTAYSIDFNTTENSYQILKDPVDTNAFVVQQGGNYLIEISIIATSTVAAKRVNVWLRKNGVDVPRSNTPYDFKSTNAIAVIAVPFVIDLRTADNFSVMYSGDSTGITLPTIQATTSPPAPVTPSAIMTLTKLSDRIG